MAVASFSINYNRSMVIDFSAPYYHSAISMLANKTVKSTNSVSQRFSFLDPFSSVLWVVTLSLAVGATGALVSHPLPLLQSSNLPSVLITS